MSIIEYYHTDVNATEKLLNSEAKPRFYDNFEGDDKGVVIFLSTPVAIISKLNIILLVFHFYFLWTFTLSKVSDIFGSVLRFVLMPPSHTHTHTHTQTRTHT